MENIVMFIIGTIVFTLYIVGYLLMIKKQNELQQQQLMFKNSQVRKARPVVEDEYTIDSSISRLKSKTKASKAAPKLTTLETTPWVTNNLPGGAGSTQLAN